MQVYESKIVINATLKGGLDGGQVTLMRTDYFMDRLEGLEGYNGFFPRVLLPSVKMYNKYASEELLSPSYDKYVTQTLFMIDSKAEIYGHMGVDFPPVPLLKGEIQIHKD